MSIFIFCFALSKNIAFSCCARKVSAATWTGFGASYGSIGSGGGFGGDYEAVALRFIVRRKVVVAPCVQCMFKFSTGRKNDQNKAIETNEWSYLVKD